MNRIPDRDERDKDDFRKGGHVAPPERNPVRRGLSPTWLLDNGQVNAGAHHADEG
jgi:hypothetical protein